MIKAKKAEKYALYIKSIAYANFYLYLVFYGKLVLRRSNIFEENLAEQVNVNKYS